MPRPTQTEHLAGTVIGGVLGGFLGGRGGARGAVVGASLGALAGSALNPTTSVPLETALARFIAEKGFTFGGMERPVWNHVRVVFGQGSNFFYIDATVPANRSAYPNVEALDDALYDVAVLRINDHVSALGLG